MHPEVNGELARPIASVASSAELLNCRGMTVGGGGTRSAGMITTSSPEESRIPRPRDAGRQ